MDELAAHRARGEDRRRRCCARSALRLEFLLEVGLELPRPWRARPRRSRAARRSASASRPRSARGSRACSTCSTSRASACTSATTAASSRRSSSSRTSATRSSSSSTTRTPSAPPTGSSTSARARGSTAAQVVHSGSYEALLDEHRVDHRRLPRRPPRRSRRRRSAAPIDQERQITVEGAQRQQPPGRHGRASRSACSSPSRA